MGAEHSRPPVGAVHTIYRAGSVDEPSKAGATVAALRSTDGRTLQTSVEIQPAALLHAPQEASGALRVGRHATLWLPRKIRRDAERLQLRCRRGQCVLPQGSADRGVGRNHKYLREYVLQVSGCLASVMRRCQRCNSFGCAVGRVS